MTEDADATRIAELEADNRRLRLLLDRGDAPAELRHRLQSTLAMLRVIIRKSAETTHDLAAYVNHLEDRIAALARAQSAADDRGSIELYYLFAEEMVRYTAREGERLSIAGPNVFFRPRAGQVLALAIHELAVNAVEHGALSSRTGRIDISWTIDRQAADPVLTIDWKEFDATDVKASTHEGFGTEVLVRTLDYELRGHTILAHHEGGLHCTIRFPLSDRVGYIAD